MRLSAEMDEFVSEEARRTRRSKGAVVEMLATEALKARRIPGIAFRGQDWDRRPWVIGTALDVWQIVEAWKDFDSIEEMARESDINERQIRIALAYYELFAEEIDADIASNRRSLDELRREYPTIDVLTVDE